MDHGLARACLHADVLGLGHKDALVIVELELAVHELLSTAALATSRNTLNVVGTQLALLNLLEVPRDDE